MSSIFTPADDAIKNTSVILTVVIVGVSLLWVAILGLIVIYIYALVGFSLLRAYFSPGEYLYCSTLWQCTVTVIRYGLIGDMFDVSTKNILNKLIGSLIGVKQSR